MRVRVALAAAIAWAGLASWPAVPPPPGLEALGVGMVAAREALIGAALGFATGLVFYGFDLLGEFASIQGGLGAAAVLDPSSGASSVVLSSLLQMVGLMVLLAMDGHHTMLRGLSLSFQRIPIGAPFPDVTRLGELAGLGALIFQVAVRLAAPITVAMLVSNTAVGMLGRAIPQLNLMALQLPAHVAVTLLLIGVGAGPLTSAMSRSLEDGMARALQVVLGGG